MTELFAVGIAYVAIIILTYCRFKRPKKIASSCFSSQGILISASSVPHCERQRELEIKNFI